MNQTDTFALRSRRTIIDGVEQPATVLIRGGKIADILGYDAAPNTQVEDLGDAVLMPGLVGNPISPMR